MIRPARARDRRAILAIDAATRTPLSSPAPHPADPRRRRVPYERMLVAELEGKVAGYLEYGPPNRLHASDHVLMVQGLSVAPAHQRRGAARALLEAVIESARADRYRRVVLRVLGHNAPARALYTSCGFEVEGVLREFFLLDGHYVDDVWMALPLD